MQGTRADEGFHEIQLSGKQLVFLFMATTVVSVVIFLCGVLVGRGVRAEKGEAAPAVQDAIVTAAPEPATDAPPAAADAAAQPPAADELSYHNRLGGEQPPQEKLKDEPPAPPPAEAPAAASAPVAAAPAPATAADGYSVQVAALRERGEADSIVKRLTAKGYPAFVVAPASGSPSAVFRVRVGTYQDRREAEQILRRLEKEEQFKPWITR
jgi:cell division septation protein DedD